MSHNITDLNFDFENDLNFHPWRVAPKVVFEGKIGHFKLLATLGTVGNSNKGLDTKKFNIIWPFYYNIIWSFYDK